MVDKNHSNFIRKKVLILHDAPLDEWKGTQRSLLEYGNYLTENGFDVTYLSPSNFKRPEGEDKINLKTDIKFRVMKHEMRHIFVYLVPLKVLRDINPDVIYVSTFNAFPFAPVSGKKIIFGSFVYGPEHEIDASVWKKFLFFIKRNIFRVVLLFYQKEDVYFHTLNETQAKWLRSLVGKRFNIFTIPPPLDCSKYFFENNESNSSSLFNILYHGPLSYGKGFSDFSHIVDKLNSSDLYERIRFNVVTVGGPLSNLAKEMEKKWKNVYLINTASEEEKIKFYRASQLLVSPSKVENFHFVTAEAQLCGLPVISSDISGPRSIIVQGITGYLVPSGDIDGFVDRIKKYIEIWENEREHYIQLREEISLKAKKFCKTETLPEFLSMVNSILDS